MRKLLTIALVLVFLVSCQKELTVEPTYSNIRLRSSRFTVYYQDDSKEEFVQSNYVDKSYDINTKILTFIPDEQCEISKQSCKKSYSNCVGYSELGITYSTPCSKK